MVGAIGLVPIAVTTFVVIGMIGGVNPEFSRGRSSTFSVVVQEIFGAVAVAMLGMVGHRLVGVARGKPPGRMLMPLLAGLVLAAVWLFALAAERAS